MIEEFRPTVRLRFFGDPTRFAPLRREALRELDTLRRENAFDLPVYTRSVRLDSGERIICRRVGEQDVVEIHVHHQAGQARSGGVTLRKDRA